MITFRGWFFATIGTGILAAGVLRMELATLLWGTLILALFVYCVVAGLVVRFQMRRHSFVVEPDGEIVAVGSPIRFRIAVSHIPLLVPGFRLRLELGLCWGKRRRLASTLPVATGNRIQSVLAQFRGAYESPQSRLICEDLFGFFRVSRGDGRSLRVAVVPAVEAVESLDRFSTPRGTSATHDRKRINSDEFLEIRPYMPGDDPRRLSWKHYAQLGDLMIRTGEPVPPPANELVCVIDSGCRSRPAEQLRSADAVAQRALAVMLRALADGNSVVLSLATLSQPVRLSANAGGLDLESPLSAEAKTVLRALACLQLEVEPPEPILPATLSGETLVIGATSSPSMSLLVGRIESRGGVARVMAIPPPDDGSRQPLISRLIFRDASGSGMEPSHE